MRCCAISTAGILLNAPFHRAGGEDEPGGGRAADRRGLPLRKGPASQRLRCRVYIEEDGVALRVCETHVEAHGLARGITLCCQIS